MGGCLSSATDMNSASGTSDITPQKGGGRSVGGGVAGEDPREAMARAALARQEKNNPGFEKAAKAELTGKLTELYTRSGKTIPFNLGALPLAQLRKLYVDMGGKN